MKKYTASFTSFFSIILLISLIFTACEGEPAIEPNTFVIHYDGRNDDAPELPGGTFEGGFLYPANLVSDYEGQELFQVQYYLQERPGSGTIRIYKGTENGEPAELIYDENVSVGEESNAWNIHTLKTPIVIENDDLWIAYRFTHSVALRSFGCDAGPAVNNGDWTWDANDGQWLPLRDRSLVNINWNIRGVIR